MFIKLIAKPDYIHRKLVLHNAKMNERSGGKVPYCDAGTVFSTRYIDLPLPYTSIEVKYSSAEHHFLFELVNALETGQANGIKKSKRVLGTHHRQSVD